jgi:pilus assembly protein CpaC
MTRVVNFKIILILGAALACARANAFPADTTPAAQSVHVLTGKSVLINVQARLRRVLVSNPTAVAAVATTPTQVVVEGKAAGESSLILWDEAGNSRMLDVTVDQDVSGLRTAIEEAFPNSDIQAQADEGRVILSGIVPDKAAFDEVNKMAAFYSRDVVDSLSLPTQPVHERQILLEVKIAEVDRTKLAQLGFNIFSTGAGNTIGQASTQQFSPVSGPGGGPFQLTNAIGAPTTGFTTQFGMSNLLNIFLFRPDINLGATIEALQNKNVLQILAAPNLLAMSGDKASFLAGGQFPVPVVQGGANVGAVTIQWEPFGVRLDFMGVVEPDNTVQLQVSPEVSTLDYTNAVQISGFTVPAISTRRAQTEVELRDGQSFGIAGLLDQRVTAQLSKIPGIGDIPVLGKFFQSRSINKTRTELIVLVTPRIVDPIKTRAVVASVPKPVVPYMEPHKYDKNMPGNKQINPPK